jgi:hypothetical protein
LRFSRRQCLVAILTHPAIFKRPIRAAREVAKKQRHAAEAAMTGSNPTDPRRRWLSAPRNALRRLNEASAARRDAARADGVRLRIRDYLRLHPYGRELLTPAAAAWIGSAWVVILLMASIEGFVWGAVGLSLVPAASAWLGPPVALFMFALMFSVIWIVDASLIMSEKPRLRGRGLAGLGPLLRWLLGLLVRVAIVGISLYVTAPFIEKLIRADDIAAWHQGEVERYFDQRAQTLQAQVETRASQLNSSYRSRIEVLQQQIERIDEALAAERKQREQLNAEYQPEIDVLTNDLAEARRRVGDEVLGREGRPEGYGPEARKWDARADLLAQTLAAKRAELSDRMVPIQTRIGELQPQLDALNRTLAEVQLQEQALLQRVSAEVEAEQPAASPPKLTFAARSTGLSALRQSPAEQGVPHFETVEGFAQAALGILFFALIALKLFEPPAVQAYYSETIQTQYRNYLNGGLAEIPGFAHHADPARRLSPVEFARRWEHWERAPTAFVDSHREELTAKASLSRLQADEEHERELLRRRREGIDHQLALEHQQREAELKARERELDLRLAQMGERLADETRLQRERDRWTLEQQRQEQADAAAEAARARREQSIVALQEHLEQHRAQRLAAREQQLALTKTLAENQKAVAATQHAIDATEARIQTQQPALERLWHSLEAVEQHRVAAGSSRFGRLARQRRRLKQAIRRSEKALAPDHKALDALRGQLLVLRAENEQLQRTLADQRSKEDDLNRRCADERAALDAILVAPKRSTLAADGLVSQTDPTLG